MTVNELIEHPEHHRNLFSGRTKVRLMILQQYPFDNSITGTCLDAEINSSADKDAPRDDRDAVDDAVIYIVKNGISTS